MIGKITIEFTDWQERKTADKILQEIRDLTKDMAGIVVEAASRKRAADRKSHTNSGGQPFSGNIAAERGAGPARIGRGWRIYRY